MADSKLPQFRIAVNSRCGRACFFCRPSGESVPTSARSELSLDQVLRLCGAAVGLGIREVKLTGGDPALWRPLVECVRELKQTIGVSDVQVISRHPRIGLLAAGLMKAGLTVLTVSIDTLDPAKHHAITGRDDLEALVGGLRTCLRAGIRCKINTVVTARTSESDIDGMIAFCEREKIAVLKLLDLIVDLDQGKESFSSRMGIVPAASLSSQFSPLAVIENRLKNRAKRIETVTQGAFGHPMISVTLDSGLVVLVKDSSRGRWFGPICEGCRHFPCHDALMALRVTPDARLQFCLLGEDRTRNIGAILDQPVVLSERLAQAIDVYQHAQFWRAM